jgi:hypothetical protein
MVEKEAIDENIRDHCRNLRACICLSDRCNRNAI